MGLFVGLLSVFSVLAGLGDERLLLVEQALDQVMHFEVQEAKLADAFATLTEETGVEITVAPQVADLLPYGAATRVSATINNITLRDGLRKLLEPLGLRFEVAGRGVTVRPSAAMKRIGRRATWEELDTLTLVRQAAWGRSDADRQALRRRVQFRVEAEDPWPLLTAALDRVGTGPGDEVLTLACRRLGWTWYPEGEAVVVLPLAGQVRRQLERDVALRMTHRPLIEVLQRVARASGVAVEAEPGVLASLPPTTRQNFSLLVEGISAREALEQIAAATGLGYRIDDAGVTFYHPGALAAAVDQKGTMKAAKAITLRDPYVAKLMLPAEPGQVQVEILIRRSELSAEALQARSRLIRQADEILRLQGKTTMAK